LFFDPEDGRDVPPKRRLTLTRLYGVVFQKTVTAERAIYPTNRLLAELHNGWHSTLQAVTVSIAENANKFPSGFVRYVLRSSYYRVLAMVYTTQRYWTSD
jgi:hypothetical protein